MSCCPFVNNMLTRELPLFKKCCFCIPLRSCLQLWACVKVVVDISLTVALIIGMAMLTYRRDHRTIFKIFSVQDAFYWTISMLFVDFGFMIALSVGVCMKSLKNLHVFYYYSFYMIIIGVVFLIGWLIFCIQNKYYGLVVILTLILLLNTCLDVCIILTVNSEIIKLRNKQQYEFVTMQNQEEHYSEPECKPEPNLVKEHQPHDNV